MPQTMAKETSDLRPLNEITLIPPIKRKETATESFLFTYSLSFLAATCSEFGKLSLFLSLSFVYTVVISALITMTH